MSDREKFDKAGLTIARQFNGTLWNVKQLADEIADAIEKAVAEAIRDERKKTSRLVRAIGALGERNSDGVTHFEGSPTLNAETAKRWIELNNAKKSATEN